MIFLPLILIVTLSASAQLPSHYDVTIVPELSDLTFTSVTTITYPVKKSVRTLTLKAKNLDIKDIRVLPVLRHPEIQVLSFGSHLENWTLDINFLSPLPESVLIDFEIKYSGKINQNLEGFYVSKYTRQNGEEEEERNFYLADFRYNKAKQVFPCEDDPTATATYSFKIVRPDNYISVSNTPLIDSVPYDDGRTMDIFDTTYPLPTHLLSFAIIDFPNKTYDDITVYSLKDETDFMGELSSQVATKFQEIEPFSLNPITQIIVPDNSISRDVLESIGLIIYRESLVLCNEERESTQDKQEVAKIVAHAVVSQWYKDSSSFQWWPHWWLTEGTTAKYQYEVLEQLQPSWRLPEQFVAEEISNTLQYDVGEDEIFLALSEDDTPDVFTKFHSIKSFSFVKMFSNPSFPNDIFENPDNSDVLSWIQNKGHPLITTTRNIDDRVFTFTQSGLVIRPVPIKLVFEMQENLQFIFNYILKVKSEEMSITDDLTDSYFIVNGDRFGYYRTNYDTTNWQRLTHFLLNPRNDISQIPPAHRAVLIEDAFYFAKEGILPFNYYFDLTQYLRRETDYIPLYAFIKTANHLKGLLHGTYTQELFMSHAVNLMEHLYDYIGVDKKPSELHLDTIARAKILTWLCSFGYKTCQDEMHDVLARAQPVPPDLQELVYCGGMRLYTEDKFDFVKEQYYKHQKKRIHESMTCTSSQYGLVFYALAIVDSSPSFSLRKEDKVDAFMALLEGSDYGTTLALAIIRENWEKIVVSFSDEDISKMCIALSKKLATETEQRLLNEFVSRLNEQLQSRFGTVFETMKNNVAANIRWQTVNLKSIRDWLDEHPIPSPTVSPETTPQNTTASSDPSETTTPSPGGGAADLKVSVFVVILHIAFYFLYCNLV